MLSRAGPSGLGDADVAGGEDRRRQQRRYRAQQRLARTLAARGALRPGLSPERAADILWALANPRTYRALVIQRGWTDEEYQHWLAELLATALLSA